MEKTLSLFLLSACLLTFSHFVQICSAAGWSSAGLMQQPRSDQTTTVLQDGRVFVSGGQKRGLKSAEIFDPSDNSWLTVGSMTTARDSAQSVQLGDGRIFVTGGQINQAILSSFEIYDPVAKSWSTSTDIPLPDVRNPIRLQDGKPLLSGNTQNLPEEKKALTYNPDINAIRRLTIGKPSRLHVDIESNAPGIGCPRNCDELYHDGEVVALTVTPQSGAEFLSCEVILNISKYQLSINTFNLTFL